MTAYILRRLLFMIPTLIGITLLLFMLVALAPGGIGAALAFAGGGLQSGQNRAIQEAYLEDRYGLKDPVIVQYLRWLGRVSPLKFGEESQRDQTGEVISPPKRLEPPALLGVWYGSDEDLLAQEPPVPAEIGETPEEKNRTYRQATNNYTNVRGEFIVARTILEQAARAYAEVKEIRGAVDAAGDVDMDRLRREELDTSIPEGQAVVEAGERAIEAYNNAVVARQRVANVFAAEPYQEVYYRIGIPFTSWEIPLRIENVVRLAPPDLGYSFSRGRPVSDLIGEALPVTLLLNFIAFPIIYIIAVPSGMVAATRQGSWFDIGSGMLFVALWSIPVVWAGVLCVGYLANDRYLGWFPVAGLHDRAADTFTFLPSVDAEGNWHRGYVLDTLWHLCLPVLCLVYAGFAVLSKQTRAAMLDNFNQDYVRTAKAKGVAEKDIVFRHVFRNSLLPIITMFATIFPAMLAGSVVVEKIFSIPGMGSLVIEAITLRDREVLLANALLIGIVNLLALLLADILYALADPRITYD